jgi:hypothetical protein
MRSVTPDIIDSIAEDFRLGVVRPLESELDEEVDDPDVQLAAHTLQDIYASLQEPLAPDTDLHFPLIGQVRQL